MIKGSDFVEGFSRTVEDDAETVNFLDLRMSEEGAASEFGRANNEIVLGFEQIRVEGGERMVVLGRFGFWRIRV